MSSHQRGQTSADPRQDGRYRQVLAVLVRRYIESGEPVSSLWLAQHGGLGVSSATLRNMLGRLEADGFLHQPHTSAGRVPSDVAYRTYVDMLLEARRRASASPEVEARLRRAGTMDGMLDDVSHELSRLSTHLGFALTPANSATNLRHIDFVGLGTGKVLVVLVSTAGQVTQKVVDTDEPFSSVELVRGANYINEQFHGLPMSEIRRQLAERIEEHRTLYDALLARTLRLASSALEMDDPGTLFVSGTSQLLEATGEDVPLALGTMRALLKMIEEKHRLLTLLVQYLDYGELTVVIGSEHASPDLQSFSLVASTYSDGRSTGAVGVIGPTRMRYSKTITAVETLSRAVTRVLNEQNT
jgi:heat-inducible transcriptional repressor